MVNPSRWGEIWEKESGNLNIYSRYFNRKERLIILQFTLSGSSPDEFAPNQTNTHNLEKEYEFVQFPSLSHPRNRSKGIFITLRLTAAQNRSVIFNFLFSESQERDNYHDSFSNSFFNRNDGSVESSLLWLLPVCLIIGPFMLLKIANCRQFYKGPKPFKTSCFASLLFITAMKWNYCKIVGRKAKADSVCSIFWSLKCSIQDISHVKPIELISRGI